MRTLIVLFTLFIASCTSTEIDWEEQSVHDITAKTTKNRRVSAITQFEVKSVGVGSETESGRWYVNSGVNYRSSYSLNVHLSPKVISQFSQKYNINSVVELIGKTVRVKGTAIPQPFCVRFGCPNGIRQDTPQMYLQTQLLITDLNDISLP